MRKYLIKIISLMIWAVVLVPLVAGADGLVKCGGEGDACNFEDLLILVKDVLGWVLGISASISAIMFAYAGFLYMTSQGSVDKRKQANKVFTNVGIGLFFIVAAWLIVKAILSGLVAKPWASWLSDTK